MGKLLKGIVKFSVAAATVGGICYVFKDKIKQSKFYQEYDVDTKIDKVKTSIKDKLSSLDNESDIIEEDELFFDDVDPESNPRDYVSLDTDSDDEETDNSQKASEDDASSDDSDDSTEDDAPEVPTINI